MTTYTLALLAVLGLWFSPFVLLAVWLVRDHRRNGRDVQDRADQLAAAPVTSQYDGEFGDEWGAWDARRHVPASTYAGGLRLVEQRATVIDLDSRRRHGTSGGAA